VSQVLGLRIAADLEQVKRLLARPQAQGVISLVEAASRLRPKWRFAVALEHQHGREELELILECNARYPLSAPTAKLSVGVQHPNVFSSGVICLGTRWSASEGLDLYLLRILRLLCFDPLLVNLQSAANASGAQWYRHAQSRSPTAFPSPSFARVMALVEPPTRVTRACPHCSATLRLPSGKTGQVQCPRCNQSFEAST
jgi:ubiquitin-protein ligase